MLFNEGKYKMKIMGILNATPDSFYDGGQRNTPQFLLDHALEMINDGADIIDIGGESTRPGFTPVSIDEELSRIVPIVKLLRENSDVPISIDTTKSEVANEALKLGCNIINDVSGIINPKMIELSKKYNSQLILMHNSIGDKRNLGVIFDILDFFKNALNTTEKLGLDKENIILDPGIGFSKNLNENFSVLRNLSLLKKFDLPILLAASNKSYIQKTLGADETSLIVGNSITTELAMRHGIDIIRVHNVALVKKVLLFYGHILH
jgi:dihydropteroate synthase